MTDIDAMTALDLCVGLMRGDRNDMRLGYSPASAALAAAQRKGLDDAHTRALLDYALGFSDGMHDAMHRGDPTTPHGPQRASMASNEQYLTGRIAGRLEDGPHLYPTSPEPDDQS
jgi:hypothetical protein